MPIKDNVNFYQIPHHGGMHNISTSLLNRMVGKIVDEGKMSGKTAFVSVAKNSDYPLQMVVNAFVRRGVKIYKTNGNTINHRMNMPSRDNWTSINCLEFNTEAEEWESNK